MHAFIFNSHSFIFELQQSICNWMTPLNFCVALIQCGLQKRTNISGIYFNNKSLSLSLIIYTCKQLMFQCWCVVKTSKMAVLLRKSFQNSAGNSRIIVALAVQLESNEACTYPLKLQTASISVN